MRAVEIDLGARCVMEWADGSQPVRQTVGGWKMVAVSRLTYRDCRYFRVAARRY